MKKAGVEISSSADLSQAGKKYFSKHDESPVRLRTDKE
jgi:hypothetical protein